MKKLYVLLVLSLFLISLLPAAMAKSEEALAKRALKATIAAKTAETGEESAEGEETTEETSEEAAEETGEEAPGKAVSACMQRLLKAKPNLLRDQAQQLCVKAQSLQKVRVAKAAKLEKLADKPAFVKYNKSLEFKARAIDKIKLEKAREEFLKAKERFEKARERYQSAKEKFAEAKEKVKECEEEETEECEEIREQIKEDAKENLISIADRILEHLNKLKAKVEANEELTEEESAEIIAKIDEQIKEVEDAKATIETSETKEDIIEAAKTLRKIWVKIKARVKLDTAKTVNARIGGIIVKSKQLEVRLNKILEKMAEDGKDTSAIEPLIEEFNAKLEEAKIKYEAAVEKFKEAKATTPPNTDLIQEGQALMKDAHKALQEAQQKLKEILLSIKQAGGEGELEETKEEEEEETKVEFSGGVELSTEAQAIVDELVASFAGVEGEVELKLKVKKKGGEVIVEKDEVKGTLTSEQQALWDSLKEQAITLVESAEGDDLELEIEIEHELEVEEEKTETEEEEELEEEEEETEEVEEEEEIEESEESEEEQTE